MWASTFNLSLIIMAVSLIYLKISFDPIEGVSKLDKLLIISVFQKSNFPPNSDISFGEVDTSQTPTESKFSE